MGVDWEGLAVMRASETEREHLEVLRLTAELAASRQRIAELEQTLASREAALREIRGRNAMFGGDKVTYDRAAQEVGR